jgi:hypothetical protein
MVNGFNRYMQLAGFVTFVGEMESRKGYGEYEKDFSSTNHFL